MGARDEQHHAWLLAFLVGCGRTNLSPSDLPDLEGGTSGASPAMSGAAGGGGSASGGSGTGGRDLMSAGAGRGGAPTAGGAGSNGAGTAGSAGGSIPTCEGEVTSDIFDPNRVYLAGTLSEGSCNQSAIAAIECPNSAAVGFECIFDGNSFYPTSAQIRPSDGRLLYTHFRAELREFHCDLCPYRDSNGNEYPRNVLDNDPVLVRASSPASSETEFLVSPSGALFYRRNDGAWVDETDRVVFDEAESTLLHVGFGAIALAGPDRRFDRLVDRLVDLDGGGSTAVLGLPDREVRSMRAAPPDRFVLLVRGDGELDADWELWDIDASATATLRGEYPPFPSGLTQSVGQQLLPNGVLFEMGDDRATVDDVIVRREIGGATEVVYTEADLPNVKIHISAFVSGP
jgi:hypothetical protein